MVQFLLNDINIIREQLEIPSELQACSFLYEKQLEKLDDLHISIHRRLRGSKFEPLSTKNRKSLQVSPNVFSPSRSLSTKQINVFSPDSPSKTAKKLNFNTPQNNSYLAKYQTSTANYRSSKREVEINTFIKEVEYRKKKLSHNDKLKYYIESKEQAVENLQKILQTKENLIISKENELEEIQMELTQHQAYEEEKESIVQEEISKLQRKYNDSKNYSKQLQDDISEYERQCSLLENRIKELELERESWAIVQRKMQNLESKMAGEEKEERQLEIVASLYDSKLVKRIFSLFMKAINVSKQKTRKIRRFQAGMAKRKLRDVMVRWQRKFFLSQIITNKKEQCNQMLLSQFFEGWRLIYSQRKVLRELIEYREDSLKRVGLENLQKGIYEVKKRKLEKEKAKAFHEAVLKTLAISSFSNFYYSQRFSLSEEQEIMENAAIFRDNRVMMGFFNKWKDYIENYSKPLANKSEFLEKKLVYMKKSTIFSVLRKETKVKCH